MGQLGGSEKVSKMGKGRLVTDKVIDRICEYLDCKPKDIIEIE